MKNTADSAASSSEWQWWKVYDRGKHVSAELVDYVCEDDVAPQGNIVHLFIQMENVWLLRNHVVYHSMLASLDI